MDFLDKNTEELLELARNCGCRILYNEPLSKHTTFRVGGSCIAVIEINSTETLKALTLFAEKNYIRTLVLGRGSNMLCDDKGFNGIVFHIGDSMSAVKMVDDTTIFAEAGCSLIRLCMFALEHSLTGLEFAYGIPGSVGGAVYMNAGAYGGEIKDVIRSAIAVSVSGTVHNIEKEYLDLSYRHSCFEQSGEIITGAYFSLKKGEQSEIESKMYELMGRRKDKQPLEFANAGSTFKRPEGYFAGKLIEDSGLKGFSVGDAQVSEKHCGFVVNKGNATCEDIMSVIEHVQKKVMDDTGLYLECEVKMIPYSE